MDKDGAVIEQKKNRKKKIRKDHAEEEAYNHAEEGAYAATNPASYKLGQIVHISYGGLVVKYIEKEDRHAPIHEKSIFLGNYGYYLGDIPITGEIPLLAETPSMTIEEVDLASISIEYLTKIRQMRMEFTELNFKQIFALDKFIRENMVQKRFSSMHVTVE
ncbi:MAG: hypothetical protein HQK67_03830 [Desulfamplus sp.]|nr:hypothetical protein [Desulfamplus sp.]